jgi:hypothetical protein
MRASSRPQTNAADPACTACPEVEIGDDEVRIGEAGNLVTRG